MNTINDRSVSISQLIRQRRTTLQLNQAQVATELHVEPESVGHWETGRRRMQLDKLPRLATSLRLNEADFCRLALFEWHPRLYATLFGTERPPLPQCFEASHIDTDQAGIRSLPAPPVAARSNSA
jgi:transcriptional regulator with XRE-family HTH domain